MINIRLVFSALAVAGCAILWQCGPSGPNLDLPSIVLWAWERSENLSFLNPQSTGVAYLAGTAVIVKDGSVLFRLRTQDLVLQPGTAVLPVVRIESPLTHAPAQTEQLLAGLERVAKLPGIRGLQIDFDARRSERSFYQTLLTSLRKQTSQPITVTALASWCQGDRWLEREPVAEAVPMLFRMGRGESRETSVRSPVCRSSLGLSTDELWPTRRPAGVQRVYLFSPKAWTQEAYRHVLQRLERWK